MNSRTDEHRRAQRRVLIGFAVVVALAGAGVVARRRVTQPNIVETPDVALNGSLSCSGDAIQVTNSDAAVWMDARVEINSKYARIVPAIPPDQTITLAPSDLTDSSGKRFDAVSMKCQSADIQAFVGGSRGHLTLANLQ